MPESNREPVHVDPTFMGIALSQGRVEGEIKGMNIELRDIKTNDQKQWKKIDENAKCISDVSKKVDNHILVEETTKEVTEEVTEDVEQKFYQKHPIKTALGGLTIGGISLTTIIGFIFYILLELKEKGLLP